MKVVVVVVVVVDGRVGDEKNNGYFHEFSLLIVVGPGTVLGRKVTLFQGVSDSGRSSPRYVG